MKNDWHVWVFIWYHQHPICITRILTLSLHCITNCIVPGQRRRDHPMHQWSFRGNPRDLRFRWEQWSLLDLWSWLGSSSELQYTLNQRSRLSCTHRTPYPTALHSLYKILRGTLREVWIFLNEERYEQMLAIFHKAFTNAYDSSRKGRFYVDYWFCDLQLANHADI